LIVFTNDPPDASRLSHDRFKCWGWFPRLEKFGPLKLNAMESWDLIHPDNKSRIAVWENSQVEKERAKRARQEIEDELREIRLKKSKHDNTY